MKIPLIKPFIPPEAKDKVWEVLESGYLTEGPVTAEFEKSVKDHIGCKHALAVTSCTTGLEIALKALGIGPGDEVIVPDYTYPATADAVALVGATIVIVDVSPRTMLMDYDALAAAVTQRTRALIPVSIFGNPLDHDKLTAIKEKHSLYSSKMQPVPWGPHLNVIKSVRRRTSRFSACIPENSLQQGRAV